MTMAAASGMRAVVQLGLRENAARDLGYAAGAVLAGVTADALGLDGAMWVVAGVTFASGVVTAWRMKETLRA